VTAPVRAVFDLVDHHGRAVTERTYRGSWLLVQFGFTACRAVCPRALAKLDAALDAADVPVVPLYISVDPERDTPDVLRAYLQERHPRFTGLTGTAGQVEAAKAAFLVFARRRPDPDDPDGYAVPHTAITHLVDPQGQPALHWSDARDAGEIAADLRRSTRPARAG
jgi:protein SCO1